MRTVTNISSVTDYSGETPVITDSNPVTTVINEPAPVITTRIFCCQSCDCDCCGCCCN